MTNSSRQRWEDGQQVRGCLQILRRILKNRRAKFARLLARCERENKYDKYVVTESSTLELLRLSIKEIEEDFKILDKLDKSRIKEKPTNKLAGRNGL